MTRTNSKFTKIYINGYEISCQASNIGTIGVTYDAPMVAAYCDEVLNTVLGAGSVQCGPINALLSPASPNGLHEIFSTGNDVANLMIAMSANSSPVIGDPMFAWKMQQGGYQSEGDGVVGVTLTFPAAASNTVNGYGNPFGLLMHDKKAETGANTGLAVIDNQAASAAGGVFVYQLFSSNGTVTLSLDDAAANTVSGDFSALSGATSGSINASVTPQSGMVALSSTATVRRYIRWQMTLGTATTATFALGFIRG